MMTPAKASSAKRIQMLMHSWFPGTSSSRQTSRILREKWRSVREEQRYRLPCWLLWLFPGSDDGVPTSNFLSTPERPERERNNPERVIRGKMTGDQQFEFRHVIPADSSNRTTVSLGEASPERDHRHGDTPPPHVIADPDPMLTLR